MTATAGGRRTRRAVAALAVLAMGACTGIVGLDDVLEGTWHWSGSQGGIAGRLLTPSSEGYSVRIELDGDGDVRAFRNDSLVAVGRFTVMERLSLVTPGAEPEYEIRFDPPLAAFPFALLEEATIRRLDDATISLAEPCCDRYEHRFSSR